MLSDIIYACPKADKKQLDWNPNFCVSGFQTNKVSEIQKSDRISDITHKGLNPDQKFFYFWHILNKQVSENCTFCETEQMLSVKIQSSTM